MFAKRKSEEEAGGCDAAGTEQAIEEQEIAASLRKIKHKLIVLSGKGGVGKSTVAVNLAAALAAEGKMVGLMDVDFHGPSVPKMLSLERARLGGDENGRIYPVPYSDNLKVMSIGFMLKNPDDAVIWRGPVKIGAIKQFVKDVEWGNLDYLVVDSPPGTGDEPLSVCQIVKPDGAVIVTTPQDIALVDVKKSITFCKNVNVPVIGVIENMSGFVCPHCGKESEIFKKGGGRKMSGEMNVAFLGSIPIEFAIMENGDRGKPFMNAEHSEESLSKKAFKEIVNLIIKKNKGESI
jgi:Mrp family chromosome partitioning ATPase